MKLLILIYTIDILEGVAMCFQAELGPFQRLVITPRGTHGSLVHSILGIRWLL